MDIYILTLEEVREVYRNYLSADFPRNERKPLIAIERALTKKQYVCYGAKEGGTVLAYAFFVIHNGSDGSDKCFMFDYFAVRKDLRGRGIGSLFIRRLLQEQLRDAGCVLLEIDNPEYASNVRDRETCERRRHFYEMNGMIDTGVDVRVFDVEYRLLEAPVNGEHKQDEVRAAYEAIYRAYLPAPVYDRMILIR